MYFADTPTRQISTYDFDPAAATSRRRRVLAPVPEGAGRPDGTTVDAEGFLWSANCDGWRLPRYTPDGRIDRVMELPAPRPTSCAFAGSGLDLLYVTSASFRLSDEARAGGPLAGGLFATDAGGRGLPEPRFAG